jgi:rod shape determining protein RodA
VVRSGQGTQQQIDWLVILIYAILVIAGWLNIYAADFEFDQDYGIFNLDYSSGKQLLWIGSSILLIALILLVDYRIFESVAFIAYAVTISLLILVLFFGTEVAGSRSWFEIGSFRLQPSEFAKIFTALALAKFVSSPNRDTTSSTDLLKSTLFFLSPLALIILQGDAGTAIIYLSFFIVLFREGISPILLITGLGMVTVFLLTLVISQLALIIGIIILALIIVSLFGRTLRKALLIISSAVIAIGIVISVEFVLNDVLKPPEPIAILLCVVFQPTPKGSALGLTKSRTRFF